MIKKASLVSTMTFASVLMMVTPAFAVHPGHNAGGHPDLPQGPAQRACDNNFEKEHGQAGPWHAQEVGGNVHCSGTVVPE